MSSLVIGLDINDSHITSALVRIGQLPNKDLSIVRDTYFTRSFEINSDTNPREIISIWIECINDLILDFIQNYQDDDDDHIIGISIGIPDPMDYQSGICYNQSGIFQKFFGLNLRLSLESGLENLVSRWKQEYDKSLTTISSPKQLTIFDKLQQEQIKQLTITPPIIPRVSFMYNLPPIINEDISEKIFSKKDYKTFCGLQEKDNFLLDDGELSLSISRSRRDTYFHDIEINPRKKSLTTNQFNPKLWSIIEQLSHIPITFYNDTICFALGEITNDYNQNYQRILALTLSSTFGSAFIDQGEIITNRDDIPPDGTLWNCPYDQNSLADDWFSIRGLINIYKKLLRHESPDDSSGTSSMTLSTDEQQQYDDNLNITNSYLIRRASNGDSNVIKAFQTYARLLGQFLIPYINSFHPELIIIGGNLSQIWYLIEDELNLIIKKFSQVHIYFSLSQGKSVSLGAVQQQLNEPSRNIFRQTHQNLLPVVKTIDTSEYDIYPTHQIPLGYIGIGHKTLNEKLFNLIEKNHLLLIEGFVGTYFYEYAHELNKYYLKKTHQTNLSSLLFYDTRTYLQTDSNIQRELYLQNPKSFFGRLTNDLDFKNDFLDLKKFNLFKNNLSYPCVVIGPASSYINEDSPLVYIDLSKNELYYRLSTQTSFSYLKPIKRLKTDVNLLTPLMYEQKCLYFLDYPIFNKLKQEIIPRINFFIDGQRPNCPTWMDGETFRQSLAYISNQPIRLRPWFESSLWGGQWLKNVCKNLSKHAKNYAYGFEMIPSENGLILSDKNNHLIELSWDIFYGLQSNQILGNDYHYRLFHHANDFPIRFNFLDTIDGGNLSLQCHPNREYIHKNFGEKFSQDQTYYIIQTKQHWKEEYQNDQTFQSFIYLAFQNNINSEEFQQDLLLSYMKNQDFNIDKYIQCYSTNIHEFYLIPNETIYSLGRNQVVLEISSAPFIYTFKLYDWLRTNVDSQTNLLNIEHGIKNLKFDRHGEELHCQPKTIEIVENKYIEQHLPTHDLHFYDVYRLIIEVNESIEIIRSTENRFHLCMLVEGDQIEIEFNSNDDKQIRQFNYIESFLIPASIKQYRLRPIIKNKNNQKKFSKFILLVAFLKWDCEKLLE